MGAVQRVSSISKTALSLVHMHILDKERWMFLRNGDIRLETTVLTQSSQIICTDKIFPPWAVSALQYDDVHLKLLFPILSVEECILLWVFPQHKGVFYRHLLPKRVLKRFSLRCDKHHKRMKNFLVFVESGTVIITVQNRLSSLPYLVLLLRVQTTLIVFPVN